MILANGQVATLPARRNRRHESGDHLGTTGREHHACRAPRRATSTAANSRPAVAPRPSRGHSLRVRCPLGLSLSSSGAIRGLAKAPDSAPFTVTVEDATGATSSAQVTIDVAAASATLAPGQELTSGQSLWSGPNGYWAVMQGDGNFVIYNSVNGSVLWATFSSVPGSYIVMQTDGNLVVYSPSGVAQWSSGTQGNWGIYASMQGDSNFVLYGPTGRSIWDYATGLQGNSVSTLYTGQTLNSGQELWTYNGGDELAMQSDGNLVVYQNGNALWATFTSGDNHLVMQTDGNLVVYNTGGLAQWDSGTAGNGFYAVIQADSNFVIYSPSNGAQWDYGSGLLTPVSTSSVGQKIVNAAASQAGIQYCFAGGNQFGPTKTGCSSGVGYDCTGLDMYAVYQATGIVLPHSGAQGADGGGTRITSEAALEPGDLVFFGGTYDDFVHSGIYAGGGEFWMPTTTAYRCKSTASPGRPVEQVPSPSSAASVSNAADNTYIRAVGGPQMDESSVALSIHGAVARRVWIA